MLITEEGFLISPILWNSAFKCLYLSFSTLPLASLLCNEIEKNNRMGKTRDLFKTSRDTRGTLHAKMGTIKDRNGKDLREAKDIKKKWQEHTEERYKKGLNDQDNHDNVVTHLESGIMECEVKRALGSIVQTKLVEVMEFQWSYLKS